MKFPFGCRGRKSQRRRTKEAPESVRVDRLGSDAAGSNPEPYAIAAVKIKPSFFDIQTGRKFWIDALFGAPVGSCEQQSLRPQIREGAGKGRCDGADQGVNARRRPRPVDAAVLG